MKRTIVINESQVVNASLDKVWDIVSDVDNDPKYFDGLQDIKNIRKEGNRIDREVRVGFMKHEALQTIVLNPKKSVELTMTKGPILGTRVTTLSQVDDGVGIRTRIDVAWNFTPSGIPQFVHALVKNEITKGTKEALQKIADDLEQKEQPAKKVEESSARLKA